MSFFKPILLQTSLNTAIRGLRTSTNPLFVERSINKVQILGRVGGDPRVFVQDEQRQLVFFSVVTNEVIRHRQEDGTFEDNSRPTWHSFVVRRPGLRDYVSNYIMKGSRVLCTGSLQNRTVTLEDGSVRKSTNIVLNDIIVVDDNRRRMAKEDYPEEEVEDSVAEQEQ